MLNKTRMEVQRSREELKINIRQRREELFNTKYDNIVMP
jgi:hypothetical protein